MKNIFKICVFVCLMNIILFSSGCTINRQLHERLIIQGVCIDRTNSEYILTLNIFNSDATSSENKSDGDNQDSPSVVTCKGKSVMDAFSSISSTTGKKPLYSQNLILIMGEEAAKHGVNSFIDFFVRHYESRPSIELFVFKGLASDVMKCKLNGKPITAKTIESLSKSSHLNMNVMSANLIEFVSRMQNKTASSIAAALTTNDEDELVAKGTAIFFNDKLINFLDSDETKGSLLVCKNVEGGTEVVNVKDIGLVSYAITSTKCDVNSSVADGLPNFDINVNINANVYEIDRPLGESLPQNSITLMQEGLSDHFRNLINKSINKCIFQNKCDVFNFGRRLMISDPSYFKTVENDWIDVLPKAKYNVKVSSTINKMGQEISLD